MIEIKYSLYLNGLKIYNKWKYNPFKTRFLVIFLHKLAFHELICFYFIQIVHLDVKKYLLSCFMLYYTRHAGIAQLVEHNLAKVGVESSSLFSRSKIFSSGFLFKKLGRLRGNSSVGRA